jgi:hypothetical protein
MFVLVPSTFSVGAVLLACGGDDTIVTDDGGPDGAADGKADDGADGTADTGGPDVVDAGQPDVKSDVVAPKNVGEFATQVERALCSSLTRCCFGNANLADGGAVDGGTYNASECGNLYRDIGFEFSSTGAGLVDGGEAVVDDVKSVACLDLVGNLPCELTGAQMAAARTACFEALVGTRTAGEKCEGSIECARGLFCSPDAGTCAPLVGDGGSCAIFDTGNDEVDAIRSEEACSWRGSGDTQLRCEHYDTSRTEPPYYFPRDQWRCRPQVPEGSACNSTVWCKDSICDGYNGYFCTSPVDTFAELLCGRVVTPN